MCRSGATCLEWYLVDPGTNFIVVGVTLLRLEPMIYHTHSEHANHYTTDAVSSKGKSDMFKIQGRQQKKNYIMYILKV
jgi:hypothetical protein